MRERREHITLIPKICPCLVHSCVIYLPSPLPLHQPTPHLQTHAAHTHTHTHTHTHAHVRYMYTFTQDWPYIHTHVSLPGLLDNGADTTYGTVCALGFFTCAVTEKTKTGNNLPLRRGIHSCSIDTHSLHT